MFSGERARHLPRPHLVLDRNELADIVVRLRSAEFVTVDIETTGNPDALDELTNEVAWVGLATTGQRYLIPLSHPVGELIRPAWTEMVPDLSTIRPYKNQPGRFTQPKKVKVEHEAEFGPPFQNQIRPDIAFGLMGELFFAHDQILVGHNLKFDLKSLAKYYGGVIPEPPYVDTLLLLHITDDNRSDYKLKPYICDWMLGLPSRRDTKMRAAYYPEVGKEGIAVNDIYRVAAYLNLDIAHTTRMYLDLMGRLPESLMSVLEAEMAVYEVVMQMEYDGINVDLSVIEDLDKVVVAERDGVADQIADHLGATNLPDLGNINFRRRILFDPVEKGGQGLDPIRRTKTGIPKLDKDVLVQLAAKNDMAKLIQSWSKDEKLHATFTGDFGRFIHPGTKRVHATFKLHGTPTGRASCEYPNLQQIPVRTERGQILRRAFIPAEGGSLVVADYDQIELRCIAYLCGDPEMIRLFRAGEDIHAAAAAAMYSIALEKVDEIMRANGKTTNFAIGYGSGPERLSNIFGVSLKAAQRMIDNYYAVYDHINPWKAEVIKALVKSASRQDPRAVPYIEIPPYGRRRRLPKIYASSEYDVARAQRQAVNAVVQGYAAYILKQALVNVSENLRKLPARIVSQIHDELVVEVLDRSVEAEVYSLVIAGMESVSFDGKPALGPVPLLASGGIGPNWIEAKKG